MTVRVLYFASLKEAIGTGVDRTDLAIGSLVTVNPVFVPEETPVTQEAAPEEDEEAAGSTELAAARP